MPLSSSVDLTQPGRNQCTLDVSRNYSTEKNKTFKKEHNKSLGRISNILIPHNWNLRRREQSRRNIEIFKEITEFSKINVKPQIQEA